MYKKHIEYMLHPQNAPNPETLISRYLAVQIQIENLF